MYRDSNFSVFYKKKIEYFVIDYYNYIMKKYGLIEIKKHWEN